MASKPRDGATHRRPSEEFSSDAVRRVGGTAGDAISSGGSSRSGRLEWKDGCSLYFRGRNLRPVDGAPPPKKRSRTSPAPEGGLVPNGSGATDVGRESGCADGDVGDASVPPMAGERGGRLTRAPTIGSLKNVLGGMFSGRPRLEGRVRWFSKEKGFGKIAPIVPRGTMKVPEELFVHKKDVEGGPEGPHYAAIGPGVLVTYESSSAQADGKPCAGKVKCEGLARPRNATGAAESMEDRLVRRFVLSGLRVGVHQATGQAKVIMEDRIMQRPGIEVDSLGGGSRRVACAFFGVFDGHAGASCSDFVATRLDRSVFDCLQEHKKRDVSCESVLRSALLGGFRMTEHNFHQYTNKLDGGAARTWKASGTTACTATLMGPDEEGKLRLLVANVGDSRAVLGKLDGRAVRLSEDHKPELPAERRRIELQGGTVAQYGGAWRVILTRSRGQVPSGLSVSRSLGDMDFKMPVEVVSPVPEITSFEVLRREDAFVLLASDGVFNTMSDAEAVRLVCKGLRQSAAEDTDIDPPSVAAKQLVEAAHARDATDDKTALVIWFGDIPEVQEAAPRQATSAIDVAVAAATVAPGGPVDVVHDDIFAVSAPTVPDNKGDETLVSAGDPEELALLDDIFTAYARDLGSFPEKDAKKPQ